MTVAEYIELLKLMPQNAHVLLDAEYGVDPLASGPEQQWGVFVLEAPIGLHSGYLCAEKSAEGAVEVVYLR